MTSAMKADAPPLAQARRSLVQSGRCWVLPEVQEAEALRLSRRLGVSPATARVLAARARGGDPAKLLEDDLEAIGSPFALAGVERAVERIRRALDRRERIFLHGDFDVDGLTSTALFYKALRRLGAAPGQLKVEIEDRERGHGLNPDVVRHVVEGGFRLLITADCGISDVECIEALRRHGVDVIVTDHHQPPEALPPACAIVNPKQEGCRYPNPELAAVGVAFQTVAALFERLGPGREAAYEYLDLVLLGTVGDLVPLVRDGRVENRVLVKAGLELLAQGGGTLGLRVLLEKLSLDPKRLTAGELSYIVIPKLNAANRVGDPRVAFLLLTTEDPRKADYWASILIDYNTDRQLMQGELRAQAEAQLREQADLERDKIIILSGRGWNPGIIGLVASDLVEKYYRPTILISEGEGLARGSGRSIVEFNLIEGLARHKELFERYGGHPMAAGFSMRPERIPELRERLRAYAQDVLAGFEGPTLPIDAELRPEEVSLALYEELQRLGPFGVGNPAPRFLLKGAWVCEARAVGSGGKHLKLRLKAGDRVLEAIGFDLGPHWVEVYRAGRVDLVCKLDRDSWNGRTRVRLELLDVLEPSPGASGAE